MKTFAGMPDSGSRRYIIGNRAQATDGTVTTELLQGFHLGERRVEPLTGQISGPDGAVHVAPKAMEVLVCLAEHPGEVVERDTLLNAAWGAGQGSQEGLSHAISELRHAFDDHSDNPTVIQTLPRRGYRLLVTPAAPPPEPPPAAPDAAAGDASRVSELSLFENLNRRGVLETAIAYGVLGWLLIQVADVVFDRLHFPDWTATFVTALVIAGFPIALVLSWFLDFRDGRAVLADLSPADARKRRFGRTYVSVIGALSIAGAGVYVYDETVGLPRGPGAVGEITATYYEPPPVVENSFAVLPFMNIDGSEETQIFANGLVEDVITRLSKVPGLRVSSRGDAFSLSPNSSSKDVRDRLRVQQYLEGSVELVDNQMRVTVQMIDSETGFHEFGRKFTGPREDVFKVRDEITGLTVANVRVALPPGVRGSSLAVTDDPSLDAYLLYRRGIEVTREPQSVDTVASALGWFDAALNVDPDYAAAHAGKCFVFASGYAEADDPVYIDRAQSSCARALALNPNLDIVHTALGDLYVSMGQYAQAEEAYKLALATDPANVTALKGLGILYMKDGRLDEAETNLRIAVDVHPGDASTYNFLGGFLYRTGRYVEAAQQYRYVVALQPDNMNALANLGAAYTLVGDFAEAASAHQRAIDIRPTKNAHNNLGLMHYYLGDYDAAIDNLASAVELEPNDYLAKSNLGDALWVAGRDDDARAEYRKAEALAISAYRVNPNDTLTMMDLGWIKAMLDKQGEARELIDRVLKLAPEDPYSHYYDALVHLRAGDEDKALEALEIAADKGYSKRMLAAEPHLAPLRKHAEFGEIVNSG
ncbi:MAG: tetratricopeptide repeat protein [Gammaproteobacteria bacterium]|nr:tetratricopeptide repeat protein [Gammaproteobacteria bacterium]